MNKVNEQIILELTERGGGWAAKALFDDAASRIINGEKQNFKLAEAVFKACSGRGTIENLKRYCKLTGFQFNLAKVSADLRQPIEEVLPLETIEKYCPAGELSNYWLEKLCDDLGAPRRKLAKRLETMAAEDGAPIASSLELLNGYSVWLMSELFDLPADDVRFSVFESEQAELCWRRWHFSKTADAPVLFESRRFSGLKCNQFFVWRLVHDAAHLFHLAKFPQAGNPLDPLWLATMEAAAMFAEKAVYERVEDGTLKLPPKFGFDAARIKTILLLGFAERALRLDYDLSVHLHNEPVEFWVKKTLRQTGLPAAVFKFAEEFHGLPGFSSAYLLGAESFTACGDRHAILRSTQSLDFFAARRGDELSHADETDIPSQQPTHALKINRVGTTGAMLRANAVNPLTSREEMMNFTVELTVDLAADRRGIHMSRLQQIVLSADEKSWNDISNLAAFLAQEARLLQQSQIAYVALATKLSQQSFNVLSGTNSAQPLTLKYQHQAGDPETKTVEITLSIMTACPCTLTYSRLKGEKMLRRQTRSNEFVLPEEFPPTFTHSQPGELSVTVETNGDGDLPNIPTLLRCVDAEAHLVESVLKRPDEHRLVEKTHRRPQFGEDVCRTVAVSVASILNAEDKLKVGVSLNESIHPHRVYAEITAEAAELWC